MKSRFRSATSARPSSGAIPHTLELWWPEGAALLSALELREGVASFRYSFNADHGVPADVVVGSVVPTVFVVGAHQREFRAHLTVVARRAEGASQVLSLAFMPDEADRQELITMAARGESIPYLRRGAERFSCALRVSAAAPDGVVVQGDAVDISQRGLFMSLDPARLRVDTPVALTIEGADRRISGRVVSTIRSGPSRGAGIEFTFGSSADAQSIRALLARLR